MSFSTYGRHVVADMWGVDSCKLDDIELLSNLLIAGAEKAGATILNISVNKFHPHGVTVLVMLSESHISIHTYPEKCFAAVDCYTCGEKANPQMAVDYIIETLKPDKAYYCKFHRGIETGISATIL